MTIIITVAAAVMLAVSAPAATTATKPAANAPRIEAPAKEEKGEKNKAEEFNPLQLLAMFDKFFPPQPDPAPERLALSRVAVQGLFPDGTYARMVDGMMNGMVDRVLNMSEADFEPKGKDGKPASTLSLRDKMKKDDPHFEERMRISQRVIGEEMAKIARIIEPKMREGLSRSMARRFDPKQLADINAFLATDSGRAFGSQSMAMWVDGDVMRAMVTSFPDIFMAMPGAMKRLETETAHLPKPPKKEDEKSTEQSGEDEADSEADDEGEEAASEAEEE